ncbi:hypothetical protein SAMN02910413_1006 [Pseudobutyrivibrio sp. C4]|uniref:hypothetical protein n=1 Tax=Pseudobutyrivibrio sp. C4 TaxID=1520803 RepID=UPI0008D4DFC1|nr:hypothetical protein [Pseudobutyrivibrio sp. C4]SES86549.1 hypothetical protein SAMN02910413_1006 [Pseudobutyrivibrio sp. C4]
MRRGSAKALAAGLSTITLASSIVFPIQVEASENSEGSVVVPSDTKEQQVVSPEEAAVESSASATESVAETLVDAGVSTEVSDAVSAGIVEENATSDSQAIAQDITDANQQVSDAATAVSGVADAKDTMDSSIAAADESLASANDTASSVAQVTGQASEVANAAVVAVADTNTDQESAEAIIADATATVEEAEKQFASAEETYNNKLSEYESAKAEYEAAAEEYNNKKSQATSDLSDAEATLTDAQEKLASLEEQLEAAGQDLAAAGADALIAADADKSDVTSYIATVVEHYYAPNTELADGQSVSNFTVTPYKGNVIGISYDIVDADGNVVRNVSANYGYTVDYKSGEVRIYDRDMVYEYQDINGNTVSLTKEEAEQLKDGVIEYSYWTATGFYIPSYNGMVYEGEVRLYDGVSWRYKKFDDLVNYEKTIGRVVTSTPEEYYREYGYFKYYQGTSVSSTVKNSKYTSEDDLKNAIVDDAKKQNKATGVAFDKSRLLNITEHNTTAEVYSYEVNKNQVFTSASKDYASYISEITEKYNAYKALSEAVSSAKADFESAKQTVSSLKQQIADLDAASDINTGMELARLQGELEKAQANYDIAKSNLADAKEALATAKSTYEARFNTVSSIALAPAESEEVIQDEEEIEEEELEEEEIEDEESVEEIHIITFPSGNAGGYGYGGEAEIPQDQPEEPAPEETVTIEEEQSPTGITLAGLMERGKWFVGLAGVSTAGVGVGILEAKRRAAIKLIDKLNQ